MAYHPAKNPRELPSVDTLRSLFEVREDGELVSRVDRRGVKAGQVLGGKTFEGYKYVRVLGEAIFAHRVVFAITHGRWPDGPLDHINRIRHDNRPENLRENTSGGNGHNKTTTGVCNYKGVSKYKRIDKFQAQISHQGKRVHLGYFDDEELAALAYDTAAIRFYGEFASLNSSADKTTNV